MIKYWYKNRRLINHPSRKPIPRWNEDIEPYRKDVLALSLAVSRKTIEYSTPSSDEAD